MSALRQAMVGKSRPTTATEGPALWRGEIIEVLANGLVWVVVPRMGGQDPIGPINSIPTGLVAGDRVVVGSIGGDVNDLIVMSLTVARPTPPAPHRHTYADIDGVIPTSALPPLAVIDTFTAGSQAQMLTLTAQRGDMCIRTDTFLTFVLAADDPTKLVNWKTITAAGQVTSVNGKTGTVQLVTDDINGLTTALAGKANVIHTHDITAVIGLVQKLDNPGVLKDLPDAKDFNTILDGGPYFVGNPAATGPNAPTTVAGMLEVFSRSNYVWHRYTEYTTGWREWRRARSFTGVWSAWRPNGL